MVILDCWKQPHWLGNQHEPRHEHSILSSHLVRLPRPPSPNCHCSCHSGAHEQREPLASSLGPTAADQTHIYSTVQQKAHSKRNDHLLLSTKRSCLKYSLKTVAPFGNVKQGISSSRDSNYCDITDLYECPFNQSRRTSSVSAGSDHYHRICSVVAARPKNILHFVRINPFKFTTMEPLQVDNRLLVFSLLDNFTKLSPNKIFENFIKKLKDEGRKSITVFNLSEPIEHMRESLDSPICEFGWPERHAPSLEKLCALCKAIDSWLSLDSTRNVAVIYSKRDLSRSSLAIAVFLQYVSICLAEDSTFDFESMQLYYEHNLQQYLQPSQRRYIQYFRNLLSGQAKINSQQYHLNYVVIRKIPNFDGNGLCKPFIKIYQGMSLLYSSPIVNIDVNYLNNYDFVVFPLQPSLKLRGDILIKCYHKRSNPSARTVMLSLQFHTGTLLSDMVTFAKDDIDIATFDKRFHEDTQIELMFNDAKFNDLPQVLLMEDDQIVKWNSYENFFVDDASLEYTKGPLDGSLYATVAKRSNTQLSSKSLVDEGKLDELLHEIFLEIESFPDIATTEESKSKDVSPLDRQSLPKEMTVIMADSAELHSDTLPEAMLYYNESVDSADGQLTWLQKQQLKLKNKQDKFQTKRNIMEKRLLEELKDTIKSQRSAPVEETQSTPDACPAIPVRTSSRNIVPLFAEQQNLGQPVRTLSLDHSGRIVNGTQYHASPVQYSTMPISPSRPLERTSKLPLNGDSEHKAFENSETARSPVRRPTTPSFPVQGDRHSVHSPTKDYNSGNVPLFIKDTSSFWYKPHISREEGIKLLQDKPSGTFIIRDSNSFQGAYGLALKVTRSDEVGVPDSVRHFLIESSSKGVQIKGCLEEPVFSSLAALVYQHSISRISLPTTLIIPSVDIETEPNDSYLLRIYENGAACNVIYFVCEDIESLTGDAAISKVIDNLLQQKPNQIKSTVVHLKASNKGITLTDNSHKIFFRQHYPLQSISHCFLDPENRSMLYLHDGTKTESVLFGFVARKKGSSTDNQCLIFGQFEPDQPSHAIVDFVNKLMLL